MISGMEVQVCVYLFFKIGKYTLPILGGWRCWRSGRGQGMTPCYCFFTVPEQQQAEPVQIILAPGEQVAVLPSLTEEVDTPVATAVQVEPIISASVLVESSPSASQPAEEQPASPGEWCSQMRR